MAASSSGGLVDADRVRSPRRAVDRAALLNEFPIEPMPMMLVPLEPAELDEYRRDLAERFKRMASGG